MRIHSVLACVVGAVGAGVGAGVVVGVVVGLAGGANSALAVEANLVAPDSKVSLDLLYSASFDTNESGVTTMRRGTDVVARDSGGRTLLFFAGFDAFSGGAAIAGEKASLMIDAGAVVDAADNLGHTPLMMASLAANSPVIQTLLGAKADVNAVDKAGMTALMYATAAGDWLAVKEMESFMGSSKGGEDPQMKRTGTAMVMQMMPPPPVAIEKLLQAGANVNAQNEEGWTPLMIAATTGWMGRDRKWPAVFPIDAEELKMITEMVGDDAKRRAEMEKMFTSKTMPVNKVKQLLAAGAKQDLKNKAGETALDLARMRNDSAGAMIVALLEGKSAPAGNDSGPSSVLSKPAEPGSVESKAIQQKELFGTALEEYVDAFTNDPSGLVAIRDAYKPRVQAKDSVGRTLLHAGAIDVFTGDLGAEKVRRLIEAGADVNAKDSLGRTPMMFAAWTRNMAALKLLKEAGAKPELTDENGWNALMYAASAGDWMSTKRLLAQYLPLDAEKNSPGEANAAIPKILEQLPSTVPAIEFLVDTGLNAQSADGWTPLMIAVSSGWMGPGRLAPVPLAVAEADAETIVRPMEYGEKQFEKIKRIFIERAFTLEKVRALLKAGAQTDLKNAQGMTALDLAKKRDDAVGKELVNALESKAGGQ